MLVKGDKCCQLLGHDEKSQISASSWPREREKAVLKHVAEIYGKES
jgi:hypothetical protein